MLAVPADFDPVERGERAERFFKEGYNCCQSVVLAFSDMINESYGIDENTLASMTSGFGGGFGRLREVCGAVSGMTIMAGFIRPAADPSIKPERTSNYALVQDFASSYKAENGSIVCRELLGLSYSSPQSSTAGSATSPVPSDRTSEYYRKRPCGQLVRYAATTVARKLQSMDKQ